MSRHCHFLHHLASWGAGVGLCRTSPLRGLHSQSFFKAQTRIPPGLGKDLPKGGVVLSFPRSSFRRFVVRRFVFLSFNCLVVSSFRFLWLRLLVVSSFRCALALCMRKNASKMHPKSIKINQHPPKIDPNSNKNQKIRSGLF